MRHRTLRTSFQLFLVALFAAACGDDSPTAPTETTQVTVVDNNFNPSQNQIDPGQTVTWTWNGTNAHNVTFDDMALTNSATQTAGTFTQTFDVDGEYTYYCTVHGRAVMSGRVVVEQPFTTSRP